MKTLLIVSLALLFLLGGFCLFASPMDGPPVVSTIETIAVQPDMQIQAADFSVALQIPEAIAVAEQMYAEQSLVDYEAIYESVADSPGYPLRL